MWTFSAKKRSQRKAEKEEADRLAKRLQEEIFKESENHRKSEEARRAIAYCRRNIVEYEEWFRRNHSRWMLWQTIAIVAGVVATLAGVVHIPLSTECVKTYCGQFWESFSWVRGVPAAIATIAAGMLASFSYRDDAVRHEMTANALWNELTKYLSRAEPYNGQEEVKDTSTFLNNVCRLVNSELRGWSAVVKGTHSANRARGA